MFNVKFRTCLCSWLKTVSRKLHGFRTFYITKYSGFPTLGDLSPLCSMYTYKEYRFTSQTTTSFWVFISFRVTR